MTQPASRGEPLASIGVIGGSGFYTFFEDAERHSVNTPFGDPSDDLVIGTVDGRRVAFIARHGQGHRVPPHRINYRANLWALRSVGVRQILAPCAVGSLRPEHSAGTIVVPDQIFDRTSGREHTVYDGQGPVAHVSFAHPYCARGRDSALAALREREAPHVDGGTLVVVNGPRFSSGAESRWHQAAGFSIVGMTTMPEAGIARELAMCFTTIALVTDHDAGLDGVEPVSHAEVLAVFARNIEPLKATLRVAIARLPQDESDADATCPCRTALSGIDLTPEPA